VKYDANCALPSLPSLHLSPQAAKLSPPEQEVLVALDRISEVMDSYHASSSGVTAKTSMFSSIFRRPSVRHEPTPEGEYADTRHVGQLKVLLEQLLVGELPLDRYPSMGEPSTLLYSCPH
jgi:hypothetical protein